MRGLPRSWELAVATIYLDPFMSGIVWSPCSKLIAARTKESVEVLDAVTLNRLATFRCPPYVGASHLDFSPDSRSITLFAGWELISWELQTGGCLSEIHLEFRRDSVQSLTHSQDGKMVAVTCVDEHFQHKVYTFHLPSRTCLGPLIVSDGTPVIPIWTHGKYLRFATIGRRSITKGRGSITIWEVGFTLEHPPTQVESFPIPDEAANESHFLLFPTLSRLVFTADKAIQVWDLKASKCLLRSRAEDSLSFSSTYSFSSDGHFLAFVTTAGEVHVWKESPDGYVLHQQSPPLLNDLKWLHISPNGGSIVFPLDGTINLWQTGDQIPSPPTSPTEERSRQDFILTFSLNQKSAAFAQPGGRVVTILDLKSGNLRLTINTGMQVECLGVVGDTAIVVDMEKIVTWNLPDGDRAFNAGVNDAVRTVVFRSQVPLCLPGNYIQSLSPDLSCIAVRGASKLRSGHFLEIYDVPTGTCLASTSTPERCHPPRFTRDGREVWVKFSRSGEKGWEIIEDNESGAMELKPREFPSGTFLWQSPHGYEVTDDGWLLSPTRKRLLWLPHRWRSASEERRLWSGRFLGLSHRLSNVVILEFFE